MEKRNMKLPKNTTKEDPAMMMALAMGIGADAMIRHQEATGQRDLCHSGALPSRMGDGDREILERFGVKFGEPSASDPLFIPCTLPEGWRKVATDHAMHSNLVDDKGRKRASIFYKAAFYDRRADMNLERRYSYEQDYDDACLSRIALPTLVYFITDSGVRIHGAWAADACAAVAWLDREYPLWRDAGACWE
jgi:hypothetical protein